MTVEIICADARTALAAMPAGSVHCVVTSPPYWGLRDYGLEPLVWSDDEGCEHAWGEEMTLHQRGKVGSQSTLEGGSQRPESSDGPQEARQGAFCRRCNAWRGSLGLEPDPTLYVEHIVEVMREVKRVLRDDGTLWLSMGDGYAGSWGNYHPNSPPGKHGQRLKETARWNRPAYADQGFLPPTATFGAKRKASTAKVDVSGWSSRSSAVRSPNVNGLKPKDLLMMPARVALALQQPFHTGPIRHEIDRAWLAALIDGEGTISIARNVAAKSRGSARHCQTGYTPFISIGNQDRELLDRCVAITGLGSVKLKDRPGIDGRGIRSRRDYFGWRIDADQAVRVLRDTYPYLIAKRHQAILAYALDASNKGGRALRGNGPLPAAEQEWREHLKALCNALNQRRAVDLPPGLTEPPSNIEPGWWLRSDIIWSKPNPMPESVTDRPTQSHEHVFLLAKSARYYYDADAIREPLASGPSDLRKMLESKERIGGRYKDATDPLLAASSKTNVGRKRAVGGVYRSGNKERKLAGDADDGRLNTHLGSSIPWEDVGLGRNKRSVWEIATQSYLEAHFATFPEKLVEPCIMAGTSERGCCPECGAPWERVVEKGLTAHDGMTASGYPKGTTAKRLALLRQAARERGGEYVNETRTTGWRPTCDHEGEPVPAVVCDPFAGSGTVGLVAERLGRHSTLIELNPDYVAMARERTAQMGLMPEGVHL